MEGLCSLLSQDCEENPLIPEWISVQSRGMKQWISLQLADHFKISANIRFVFPRPLLNELIARFPCFENETQEVDEDYFLWSVMSLIHKNSSEPELSDILNYIRDDAGKKKLFQISMKIARLFDDYEIYRPEMLADWSKGRLGKLVNDPAALWQSYLFQKIAANALDHHPAIRTLSFLKQFKKEKMSLEGFPKRISLFGISTLPPAFLQVFEKISGILDIYFFLLTPSSRFFLDLESMALMGKKSLSGPEEPLNLLISSLGASCARFHSALEMFNYHEPFDELFADPLEASVSMLTAIQSDILNLYQRKKGGEGLPFAVDSKDTSVSIHACHSPMRETQVLKDLLLAEFEQNPDLFPHDIVVMMPDIESYAPLIESVFSIEPSLPFSISDRGKKSESEPLETFLKILSLKNLRLEKKEVLDLLQQPSIAGKFKINTEDMFRINQMAADARILWARDGDHRHHLGFDFFDENTWKFGFDRLFLGMAMPEGHDGLVKGILPCQPFEGLDLDVLGKFAGFCNRLFSALTELEGQKTVDVWVRVLKRMVSSLLEETPETREDMDFLIETLNDVATGANRAGFTGELPFDGIYSFLTQKLDLQISQGQFMSGNITFCNILPMRSIPFKIIVLMGMDEAAFPRKVFRPGFDLIKKYPRPGDKNEREEDLYLFLETLLSARQKLIITYTGMGIKDNAPIPCASVVNELMDVMDQGFVFPDGYQYRFFHPLHPFDPAYFVPNGLLFSHSNHDLRHATALLKEKTQKKPFCAPGIRNMDQEYMAHIFLDDMIRFFRHPLEGFIRQGLSMSLEIQEEEEIDREPFSVTGLGQYEIASQILQKQANIKQNSNLYPVFKAMGSLPPGRKGKLEYERLMALTDPLIQKVRSIWDMKHLPAFTAKFETGLATVTGQITDMREQGRYAIDFGKLNASRILSLWIRHLFLNATAPLHYPKTSYLTGRDPKGKKPEVTIGFPELGSDANYYLKDLVEIYHKGRQRPFYFFCETSFHFSKELSMQGFDLSRESVLSAMGKVRKYWFDRFRKTGERQNRYVEKCIGSQDPFETPETLISSGFVDNSVMVFRPLLENMSEGQ